jgi:hypothetical protein
LAKASSVKKRSVPRQKKLSVLLKNLKQRARPQKSSNNHTKNVTLDVQKTHLTMF